MLSSGKMESEKISALHAAGVPCTTVQSHLMKYISIPALLIAAFLQFPRTVFSQTFTSKGTAELGGDFSFSFQKNSNQKDMSFNTFSFNGYAGIMALPGFEIGLSPVVAGYSGDGISAAQFSLFLMPSCNFNVKSNVFPYLELLAGYGLIDDGDFSGTVPGLGGDAGIKVKLKENGLLLVRLQYLRQFINYTEESDKYTTVPNDYTFDSITFGVGFRFILIRKSKQ
jgi:hypothetical protein